MLSIDIETYSSVDLIKCGLRAYVQSADFQVMLFAYGYNDEPEICIDLTAGEEIPARVIADLFDANVVKTAYNAEFEWCCLSKLFLDGDTRRALLWLPQWRCSMMHGLYAGYPAGLGTVGAALSLPQDLQKSRIGKQLITYFCKPCTPTRANGNRTRNLPQDAPEKWELFKAYNVQDVVAERSVLKRLTEITEVPPTFWNEWRMNCQINEYGTRVDLDLVNGALELMEISRQGHESELADLCALDNPNSRNQMLDWLQAEGAQIENLTKATVSEMLAGDEISEKVRRVLELRQTASKSSLAKYTAMLSVCSEGDKAHDLLFFYGAHTGRWAGRLIQVQNLPKTNLHAIPEARKLVKNRQYEGVRALFGEAPHVLSHLIRTALIPREGRFFVDVDFSAIEARVLAWLAGEKWALEEFSGEGKIYEAAAAQMFGVLKADVTPEQRSRGKIATLALGYQGAVGALTAMGAANMGLSEADMSKIVSLWRVANANIVRLWAQMEQAARAALEGAHAEVGGCVGMRRDQENLIIALPSGREIFYPGAQCVDGRLSFLMSVNKKWVRSDTYGGRLTENITQAIARDILSGAIMRIMALRPRFSLVFHVHDEVLVECDNSIPREQALTELIDIVKQSPPWATGLPLAAAGWTGDFFTKD